jgi:opacity protein-like surface antigen
MGLIFLAASFAQEEGTQHFTFNLGFGFTNPVGDTGRHLNEGWNLQGGFGYNFTPWVGANIDLGYNNFSINSGTLSNIGVPGGSLNVFSATVDPIVHLNPRGQVDFYVTGGGGVFHRYREFEQPSAAIVPGFDPYFGFYPATAPTSQIQGSYSVNKPGFDIGAGVAIKTGFRGKIFLEAKYDRMFAGNYHMDYLPVTAGFRW